MRLHAVSAASSPGPTPESDFLAAERGRENRPCAPWLETPVELEHRMLAAVRHIHKEFDVRSLPLQFPERLRTLVVTDTDRLQT